METPIRLIILILVLAVIVVWFRFRRGRRGDRIKITRRNPDTAQVGIVAGSDSYDCEVVGESRYQHAEMNLLGYRLAVCNAMIVGGWKATKKQEAGHFGILLDADIPFEFEFDEVEAPDFGR